MGNTKAIFEAASYKNYFSEIWAFLSRHSDAKTQINTTW